MPRYDLLRAAAILALGASVGVNLVQGNGGLAVWGGLLLIVVIRLVPRQRSSWR